MSGEEEGGVDFFNGLTIFILRLPWRGTPVDLQLSRPWLAPKRTIVSDHIIHTRVIIRVVTLTTLVYLYDLRVWLKFQTDISP